MGKDKTKRCSWYFLRDQNQIIKTKSISTWWGARAWVVTFQPGRWLLVEGFISPRLQTTITTETTQAWSQPEPACNHVGLETAPVNVLSGPGAAGHVCSAAVNDLLHTQTGRTLLWPRSQNCSLTTSTLVKSLNHSTAPLKQNLGKWICPSESSPPS